MDNQTIAALKKVFNTLDCDISHDLAFSLADKYSVSYSQIIKVYEDWQVE